MIDTTQTQPVGTPAADGDDSGSRQLLSRVLQSMSNHIAGGMADPGDTSALIGRPDPIDEPDAPGAFDEDDNTPAPAPASVPSGTTGGKSSSQYAWGGYENGRIPPKALKAIGQGGHKLEATAADAWIAMREAARKDGVNLSLTDSYRSYDQQVATRKNKGHLVATATPGTSVHGWGRAVDANVKDPKALAWLNANGAKYGWIWPKWAQKGGKSWEPWHREFVGVR